jgi:hypothetical protein
VVIRSKSDYSRAFSLVRRVIVEWDPYKFFSGGAPEDELDMEVAQFLTHVPRIRSEADVVNSLSEVFSSAFEASTFRKEDCTEVGGKLYFELEKGGFI